jgi:glycosyltransferase involved in cell wall biosynthesis
MAENVIADISSSAERRKTDPSGKGMLRKILVINWQDITNPYSGGAEIHLQEIFRRIAAKGHEVVFLGNLFHGALREEEIDGIRIVRRGNRNNVNFAAPCSYYREFRKMKFDIIVEGINKVPFFTPLYVKEPILAIVHHLFGTAAFREASLPGALYVYCMERLIPYIYRHTPFEVISKSTREDLVKRGLSADNIRVVYCGIDHSLYRPADPPVTEKEPVVACLGRIKKYKSIDHLLRAFARIEREVPSVRIEIIGEGDHRRSLVDIAKKSGIEGKVAFPGFLPAREKIRRLQKSAVVVNPSPKEGWGLTVTEANACGTVVVAADSPGLRESVRDGETGFLYPYGRIDLLADKVIFLLKNPGIRRTMEARALRWARSLTWDRAADETFRYIDAIIRESPLSPDLPAGVR